MNQTIKFYIKKIIPNIVFTRYKMLKKYYQNLKYKKYINTIMSWDNTMFPVGINLIGDIRAETGLGQSLRILADIMKKKNISFIVEQYDSPGNLERKVQTWDNYINNSGKYGINLLHINNSIWFDTYLKIPKKELDYHYNIAYWLWELEDFPDEWIPCIDTINEIWTPSEFISNSIRKKTDKPVYTIPYAIEFDKNELLGRDYFGFPDNKFLYLSMYDAMSVSERKNPQASIEAFIHAFPVENSDVGLVIKVNHLQDSSELNRLKVKLKTYHNIYYLTDNLSRKEVESLIAVSDVLISLYRSEGFGLPIAEAMYLGTPVVCTNWSAPTEFTDEKSACLVDYKLIKIQNDIGPYKKGNRWADANISHAADFMKTLYEDRAYYLKMSQNGKEKVKNELSVEKSAILINNRIDDIQQNTCLYYKNML